MTAREEDLAGASGASDELVDVVVITPTQYDALPGMPFPGPPDTYPAKEQVADYLNAYAAEFNLPVRLAGFAGAYGGLFSSTVIVVIADPGGRPSRRAAARQGPRRGDRGIECLVRPLLRHCRRRVPG